MKFGEFFDSMRQVDDAVMFIVKSSSTSASCYPDVIILSFFDVVCESGNVKL